MITSVKECYVGKRCHLTNDHIGWGHSTWQVDVFYTYLICRVRSGKRDRYNLIAIDDTCENMVILGRELTLGRCRRIIRDMEPMVSVPKVK